MAAPLERHSDGTNLTEPIDALVREISSVVAELHELMHVVAPGILHRYQLLLGIFELSALRAEVEYRRMRRVVEMVRAEQARGKLPDLSAIEVALGNELLAWQQQVQNAASRIEDALAWQASPRMTDEDYAELVRLYRQLVRQLHPDITRDESPERMQLWHRVQQAFRARDLEGLRDLQTIVAAGQPGPDQPDPKALCERLEQRLARLLSELEETKKRPPFDLLPGLDDEEWVKQRQKEAEERQANFETMVEALKLELRALMESPHGNGFGPN